MRSPVTLRELMIKPVRTGYIGQDHPINPKELPPSAAQLYPQIFGLRDFCAIARRSDPLSGVRGLTSGIGSADDALCSRRRLHRRAI
jgi:hypothetical protein